MVFLFFSCLSAFIYFGTSNFKLSLILFNIGLSYSLISIVFSNDDEDDYIEEEINKGVDKQVNIKFKELKKQQSILEAKLTASEQYSKSIEDELRLSLIHI